MGTILSISVKEDNMAEKTNKEKLDEILTKLNVVDNLSDLVSIVKDHDIILRGPNRDDGIITEHALLMDFMRSVKWLGGVMITAIVTNAVGLVILIIKFVVK